MDPELIKLAEEQMGRMSSTDFSRIQQQMMSNPELMGMALESMKNMSSEDFRSVAEQMKNTRPEEMAQIGERMANTRPGEIAAMRSQMDGRVKYELSASEMLKKKGNELHQQGLFEDALKKYTHAKTNLKSIPSSSKAKQLTQTCSLNMMSCHLKLGNYNDCIKEGSEVLAMEGDNVKALYRTGQAYRELGQMRAALFHLRKAHEISPDDETIAEILSDTETKAEENEGSGNQGGLVIDELDEGDVPVEETPGSDAARPFRNFGSGAGDLSPELMKAASEMVRSMRPEELEKMMKMTSQMMSLDVPEASGTRSADGMSSSRPANGIPKDPSRQMLASMMKSMSPETMANVGETLGLQLSKEDARNAHKAMSSLSPDDIDRMMKWVERVQRLAERARRAKNWLLGKPGMVLAIFMLILAAILHRLGLVGG